MRKARFSESKRNKGEAMKQEFTFTDIDGERHTVEFEAIRADAEFRTYGIRAVMHQCGRIEESAEVSERFITPEETRATIDMLCKCQVMPCTLRDVI